MFTALFVLLSRTYFRPFLKLIESRHQRTVLDREAALRMIEEARTKFEEYQNRISEEQALARKAIEAAMDSARKSEAQILSEAREQAKRVMQEAQDSIGKQHAEVSRQLDAQVESLAGMVADRLLGSAGK